MVCRYYDEPDHLMTFSTDEQEARAYTQLMSQFLFLIIDLLIAIAFIAAPWVILVQLNFQWPDWLKDGIVIIIFSVIWAGFALYFATQTILWLGLVP